MFKKVLATGAMLAMAASAAQAQTTVYNSIDFTPNAAGTSYLYYAGDYTPGGATTTAPYSDVVADDINVLSGYAGGKVTSFTWTMSDHNTTTGTDAVTPVISFYQANGTSGGPGTLITSITFNPITLTDGKITTPSYTPGGTIFTIPTSGLFYAGISFTSASTAVTNNIFQGVYTPAPSSVGSSSNNFFVATNPGAGTASNPAGNASANFGAAYNFGWSFTATAAPEPSQYAAFGLGILGVGALALKARRRSVTA